MTVTMQLLKGRAEAASCTDLWPLRGQCWLCVPQPGSPAAPQDSPSEGSELWEASHAPALNTGSRSPQSELMDSRREGCSEKRDRIRRLPNGCRAPKSHGRTTAPPCRARGFVLVLPAMVGLSGHPALVSNRAAQGGRKAAPNPPDTSATGPWVQSLEESPLPRHPRGSNTFHTTPQKHNCLWSRPRWFGSTELRRGRRIPHPANAAEGTLLGRGRGHRPGWAGTEPPSDSQ